MKQFKETKGITLIALVITIIVLLILAGVTLATLAGRRGLIKEAQNAETEHNRAAAHEDINLVVMQSYNNRGEIDLEKLREGLTGIGASYTEGDTTWTVQYEEETFTIDLTEGDIQ